ncbi:MAG: hypothetical protein JWN48_476 [Myxococcaceae bacterium]|nr:hypothetical protein [Myxococcaceae bacterium]
MVATSARSLRPMRTSIAVSWTVLLLLAGCDYNNDGPPEPDATLPLGGSVDASLRPNLLDAGQLPTTSGAGLRTDAGRELLDAALAERNESFESALALDQTGALQDILHSGQSNYFRFEATGQDFYELKTRADAFSPDVVMYLYDEARTLIATNDQGSLWPGDPIDARLVVQVPRAGRYYVKVEDPSTPPDFFTRTSLALRYYKLDFRRLDSASEGVAWAERAGPVPVRFTLDADSQYSFVTVVGRLEGGREGGFVIAGQTDRALIGHVLASGTMGNGSSSNPGPVRVRNLQDGRLLGEVDGTNSHLALDPPIGEGSYAVTVGAPVSVGANAFYALDLVLLPDNPREQAEASNGVLMGAEPLALQGSGQRRGLLLSDVAGGDVDYYSFAAAKGETAYVGCQGQSAGSGVRALELELRDAADRAVATGQESASHDLAIDGFSIAATGTYYVRLASNHGMQTGDAEPWVRCVVMVGQ